MRLVALISAYQDDEEGGLRATLPLAGRSLLERQARLVAAAGAGPIVVVVERMPAELVATAEQLRADGIGLVIARDAAEAAAAVEPADRVLLVADGLVAEEGCFTRIVEAAAATVMTVPDSAADERFERIDATSRWAGLALIPGSLLHSTAAELYDWDLQSTLLRRALQGGARLLPVDTGEAALAIATGAGDLAEAEDRMMALANRPRDDWASRYVLAPFEATATHFLASTAVTPEWLRRGELALMGLAALLFALDWRWAGGLMALLALPLGGVARRLAALRLQIGGWTGWRGLALPAISSLALLALGRSVAKDSGWGCMLLALVAILFLVALRQERGKLALPGGVWLAEPKGMTLSIVPFAFLGLWDYGLGALAFYSAASFFWAQHQVHRDTKAKRQD